MHGRTVTRSTVALGNSPGIPYCLQGWPDVMPGREPDSTLRPPAYYLMLSGTSGSAGLRKAKSPVERNAVYGSKNMTYPAKDVDVVITGGSARPDLNVDCRDGAMQLKGCFGAVMCESVKPSSRFASAAIGEKGSDVYKPLRASAGWRLPVPVPRYSPDARGSAPFVLRVSAPFYSLGIDCRHKQWKPVADYAADSAGTVLQTWKPSRPLCALASKGTGARLVPVPA